jgi:hypothetical protein
MFQCWLDQTKTDTLLEDIHIQPFLCLTLKLLNAPNKTCTERFKKHFMSSIIFKSFSQFSRQLNKRGALPAFPNLCIQQTTLSLETCEAYQTINNRFFEQV